MDVTETASLTERLAAVRARIAAAEGAAAGRRVGAADRGVEDLRRRRHPAGDRAPASGCFGENRVQEAKAKWPALKAKSRGLELHLIGPLQSNKARDAVALFDAIHTIDRDKIAGAIAAEIARLGARRGCWSRSIPGRSRRRPGCCRKTPTPSSTAAARCMASPSTG